MIVNQTSTLPAASSLASAASYSVAYSAPAAALATLLAVPVAWSAIRNRSRLTVLIERGTFFVQGLPDWSSDSVWSFWPFATCT